MPGKEFTTGTKIQHSGIYRVFHAAHRLPHEVILIAGEEFPRCSKCQDKVKFRLIRMVREDFTGSPVRIYELPVIGDDEQEAATGS